ncbi:MAG: hypothetical protein WC747_03340 [Candidatus Babeliales bacterium]|jgi:hypothetical protein
MNKKIIFVVVLGFSSFHCLGSESPDCFASVDCLDDYEELPPSKSNDKSFYPIPEMPEQKSLFDPGQSYRSAIQEAGSYVFPDLCDIVRGFVEYKDDDVLEIAREVSKNLTTSLGALVDYRAMQGDSMKSVAQLIQAGKLGAAVQYFNALQKQEAKAVEEKIPTESYEQKAYKEIKMILGQLREHDDSIQRILWEIQAKKIKINKELLTNLFLIIGALDTEIFGKVTDESSGSGFWIDLLNETQTVLATMHQSNVIFTDRVSQEKTSFDAIAGQIHKSVVSLEILMKQNAGSLATAQHALDKQVARK